MHTAGPRVPDGIPGIRKTRRSEAGDVYIIAHTSASSSFSICRLGGMAHFIRDRQQARPACVYRVTTTNSRIVGATTASCVLPRVRIWSRIRVTLQQNWAFKSSASIVDTHIRLVLSFALERPFSLCETFYCCSQPHLLTMALLAASQAALSTNFEAFDTNGIQRPQKVVPHPQ